MFKYLEILSVMQSVTHYYFYEVTFLFSIEVKGHHCEIQPFMTRQYLWLIVTTVGIKRNVFDCLTMADTNRQEWLCQISVFSTLEPFSILPHLVLGL